MRTAHRSLGGALCYCVPWRLCHGYEQIQVTHSQAILCSAIVVTTNPSTASRPLVQTALCGLGGIHGGNRYSCELQPLRKHVILPADMTVKSTFTCSPWAFLVDVVCEVWIILSAECTYLPGALFVLSLQFPTYFLVVLSSSAIEFLFFSFICNIVPIVSN